MIKILLKQLILEEFINSLFNHIQINLNPYKSTKYRFQDTEKHISQNYYRFHSILYFMYHNKEQSIKIFTISTQDLKYQTIEDQHILLLEEMNRILQNPITQVMFKYYI